MSLFVPAVPYTPPGAPPDPWRGVTQRWEAPDGSVWTISGPVAGGVRMMPGVRGLTEPEREVFVDEPAGISGGVWQGFRDLPRDVYWPVSVYRDTDSAGWLEYDAAWARSLDPELPGRWVVEHANGTSRYLLVRMIGDGDPAWDFSPGLIEWASYGIKGVAVDPYWRGATVTRTWSGAVDSGETFVGAGGPPFTISEGSTLASAEVTNVGDITAHPVWWVQDVASAELTIAGRSIEVPAVADDKLLVIDSDPREFSAVEIDAPTAGLTAVERAAWVDARVPAGVDRSIELGDGTLWGEVPARSTTQLGIEMSGTGEVTVTFIPRFRRAW